MPKESLPIRRLPLRLTCDAGRTIMRFFWPGGEHRARRLVEYLSRLEQNRVVEILESTRREFDYRVKNLDDVFSRHFHEVRRRLSMDVAPSLEHRLLIGAYFTMEYAFESAALFNPSMVPSANQSGVSDGAVRFTMSLRAVGEGHISSIVFKRGIINSDLSITIEPAGPCAQAIYSAEDAEIDKRLFGLKLIEMGAYDPAFHPIMERLDDSFTEHQLVAAIESERSVNDNPQKIDEVAATMIWLIQSNYEIRYESGADLKELVLFPISQNESNGMEDMRLVLFTDDDGTKRYYGTYTAYDGRRILPQLLETFEPGVARVYTLNGRYAQNKGLALFPRKIDGWYMMIARVDGENLFLLRSDNIHFWNEATLIQKPRFDWELVQIGNCGSPIETEAGWLLLTHGVGPMRRYCIGASLLDLKDPTKVIGQTREPLLAPEADERDGYVPNVVYSCGGMIHNGSLIIPYGISDSATGFATVKLDDLLAKLC